MSNTELNKYILHYLKEDRTRSAIMLTAGWGTGKSYYIQHELIPFLIAEGIGSYPCIVVSLYGLKSVDEISKSLYIESRMKFFNKGSEGMATGKFAVKTVVKGITSFFGVDLAKTEEELQELYQAVDLSGKLIIFEDVERSGIDILEILGYTYNLVEQDGIKVMLIANEDEILKYHNSEPNKEGVTYKIPDKNIIVYLKAKEKTVSDTIYYRGNIKGAISNLILSFGDKTLDRFVAENHVDDIAIMMDILKDHNLRSFLFACQKISDIYNKLGVIEDDFIQTILFSVAAFSMRMKCGRFPDWTGTDLLSKELGIAKFPLYRFCYDYIRWQELDTGKVQATFEAHRKMKLYDLQGASNHDVDLTILFDYYKHSEKEVLEALNSINIRLDYSEDIPLYSYGKLAYSLVACHTILGFDYTTLKGKMISNMRKHGRAIDSEMLHLQHFEFKDEEEKNQFSNFSQALREAIADSEKNPLVFSYNPEDIHVLYTNVAKDEIQATGGHVFISKFDSEKLVNMFFSCNSAQLNDWRTLMVSIYRHSRKTDFLETDCVFMKELIIKINSVLPEKEIDMDKVSLMQIRLMLSNLQDFVDQLS